MKKFLILLAIILTIILVSCGGLNTHSITFDILGEITIIQVNDGEKIKPEQIPNVEKEELTFSCWVRVIEEEDFVFDFSINIYRDFYLFARYIEESESDMINILLFGIEGDVIGTDQIEKNSVYTITINTTIDGYIFLGWFLDSTFTSLYLNDVVLKTDTSIYGKWVLDSVSTYLVTFIAKDGGIFFQYLTESGSKVLLPPFNTKIYGFDFSGWYTTDSFSTTFNFELFTVTTNLNIYGLWLLSSVISDHYPYEGNYYDSININMWNSSQSTKLMTLLELQAPKTYSSSWWTPVEYSCESQFDTSSVTLIYTSTTVSKTDHSSWNKEHVWPQSLMPSSIGGDLHNLWACNPGVNSSRGNKTFDSGTGLHHSLGSSTYYPGDAWVGVVARTCMYMAYRYSSVSSMMVLSKLIPVSLALQWNEQAPVTKWEMNHNDALYNNDFQKNRNPFIDHPELAFLIYGLGPSKSVIQTLPYLSYKTSLGR